MPYIRLDQIDENPKNSNVVDKETLKKLRLNIKRTKLYPPLIVRPVGDRYLLLDGKHRRLVLIDLGIDEANCDVWNVSEREADVALATLNTLRGTEDIRKRAELLDSLVSCGIPVETLSSMVVETPGQIEDFLKVMAADADTIAAMERIMQPEIPESTMKLVFALFSGQHATVRRALDHIKTAAGIDRQKNADAQALELLAAEYLAGAGLEEVQAQAAAQEAPIGAGGRK